MSEHVSDEQLSVLLDGELSLTAREAVNRHLAGCPSCAARHDQLVDIAATLRLQPRLAWTPAATGRTVSRLHQEPVSDRSRARAALLIAAAVVAIGGLVVLAVGIAAQTFGRFAALAGGGVAFVSPRTLIILAGLALLGLLAYPLAHSR